MYMYMYADKNETKKAKIRIDYRNSTIKSILILW